MKSEFEIAPVKDASPKLTLEEISKRLKQVSQGTATERLATVAVIINLLIIFCRPQYTVKLLATIQLPLMLSLLPLFFYLQKVSGPYTKGMKAMIGFLVLAIIWGPLAENNRLAFEGFRNLFQLFVFILFPLTVYFANIRSLKKLYKTMLFIGLYLGIFGLTHGGKGRGDFMGDENDLCLVLDLLIAFPLVALIAKTRMKEKFTTLLILLVLLMGIVSTSSRGGFVGLLLLGGYFVAKTPYKVPAFVLGFTIAVLGLILAPKAYIKDMSTITNTQESTAQVRLDSWKIATRIWMRPKNIVAGVGTRNGPLYMGEYETSKQKNLWGRQTHSAYFQLLLEYGIIGVILFLLLVKATLFDSIKLQKRLDRARRKLIIRPKKLGQFSDVPTDDKPPSEEKVAIIKKLLQDIEFCRQFNLVVIISFIGVLGAAAFVSILYYPPFWIVASFAGAVQLCSLKLIRITDQLELTDA